MSEAVKGEGSNTNPEGEKAVDVATLMKDFEALKSTNARLLEEAQKTKEKYRQTTSQLEQAEREKLEKDGNFQALLDAERKRLAQLEAENKDVKQKVLRSNIKATVAKIAGDVYDLDDVLNQPNFSSILKKGINDSELTLDETVATEYVNEVFKAKPYLKRNSNIPNTINSKPGFQEGNGGVKPVEELSSAEIEKLLKERYK